MIIQWHPDGLLYIRNDDWSVVFEGTEEEVEAVLGKKLAPLPEGVIERQYFVDKFCRDFTRKGQVDQLVDVWEHGDEMCEKCEQLEVKYVEKIAAKQVSADAALVNEEFARTGKFDQIDGPKIEVKK